MRRRRSEIVVRGGEYLERRGQQPSELAPGGGGAAEKATVIGRRENFGEWRSERESGEEKEGKGFINGVSG